jgi:predicted transcriptional regulator YheO
MAKLDPWLVDILKRMAESIVAVVGPHCEIVVYDFDDLEHSVVAVTGNVTGRQPGAPVPDLHFISQELDRNTPDQLNYRTRKGTRDLQSSLIWIRDVKGEPIGAIGVNIDHTDLLQARALIDSLAASTQTVTDIVVSNTFAKDLDELIDITVADFLRQSNLPNIDSMSQDDKLRLIDEVEKQGLFRIRGAVNRMADLLNVSRATIYNYRSSLKIGDTP